MNPSPRNLIRSLLASLAACLALALPAGATTVLPLYLDEIVSHAAVAFEGTCTDNRSERDSATGFIVTYTTFKVSDVLKGAVGSTYTIKQIGGELPNEDLRYKVEGVPRFTVGQDYVVFLPKASAAGFASPVGLEQGRFTVTESAEGAQVGNGRDFRDMTSRIPADQLPATQTAKVASDEPVRRMGLADFKQLIRNRIAAAPVGVDR